MFEDKLGFKDLIKKPIFFFILFVLYFSNDSMIFGTNIDQKAIYLYYTATFLLFSVSFFSILANIYKHRKILVFLFCLIITSLLTALVNNDFTGGYFLHLVIYTISFYVVIKVPFREFIIAFENTFFYMVLIGLFLYFLVCLFPSLLIYFPIIQNIADQSYYNLWLCVVNIFKEGLVLRNYGIFREPGVYMIYILVAFIINMFYYNKINKKHIVVYIVAMITSFSTAGIILLTTLMGFYLIINRYKYRYLLIVIFLLFLIYLFSSDLYYDVVMSKLESNSNQYGSSLARVASFYIPIHIFFDNIIFGSGLANFAKLFESYSYDLYKFKMNAGSMSTNFIMNKFATFGLFSGSIFVYFLYKISVKFASFKYTKYHGLFIFLILFGAFCNEDLRYSLFFNILLIYGISKSLKEADFSYN